LAKPGEGEYSHAELVGSQVVALHTGVKIGCVKGIQEYGGPPLLEVETGDGREILIPFAKTICKEIDAAKKVIGVELPEGLLEL